MLVGVGMLMRMLVGVGVFVGVSNTVVGVLMGMGMFVQVVVIATGNMIVMNMHSDFLLCPFSFIITAERGVVKFQFIIPIEMQRPQVITCGSATRKEEKKMKKRKINLSDFVLIS